MLAHHVRMGRLWWLVAVLWTAACIALFVQVANGMLFGMCIDIDYYSRVCRRPDTMFNIGFAVTMLMIWDMGLSYTWLVCFLPCARTYRASLAVHLLTGDTQA